MSQVSSTDCRGCTHYHPSEADKSGDMMGGYCAYLTRRIGPNWPEVGAYLRKSWTNINTGKRPSGRGGECPERAEREMTS